MILVDTAIWIDHLHRGEPALESLLHANDVCVHPLVIAELALGRIARRDEVLGHLNRMPRAAGATDGELLAFIEARDLAGRGLSAVDAHLLAAVTLTPGTSLWTRDRRLAESARELGVGWGAPAT